MKERRFWVRALFGLLAIGLLIGASASAFRVGWWQGYQTGQATEGDEGQAYVPGWPMVGSGLWTHHRFPGGWMVPFGGGSLLRIGLLLGVLFLIAGLFRSCAWRAAGHVPHGMPHRHWHHPHFGHHPPYGERPTQGEHPAQGHCFEGKYSHDGEAAPETGNEDQT